MTIIAMRQIVISIVSGLLAASCTNDDDLATEPAGLQGVTAEHNRIRADVGVAAMSWDPELAAIAQAWAAQCVDDNGDGFIDHDADSAGVYTTSVGENLYGGTSSVTGVAAARAWEAEKADFTYPDQCAPGQICGHYTQMVWRTSTQLGCAIGLCPEHSFGHIVVCNYAPAGNWSGVPPY